MPDSSASKSSSTKMRARQRHFKFGAISNAKIVLDSRYIQQSDNTSVSSWSDRSGNGNDVSQATPANQPTFQTAEQGGNGVVRFDGSNDVLTRAEIGISSPVKGTIIVYAKRATASTGEFLTFVEIPEYFRVIFTTTNSFTAAVGINFIGYPDNGTTAIVPSQGVSTSTDSFKIYSITYNGGAANNKDNYAAFFDGASQTILQGSGISSLGRSSTVGIGARNTSAGFTGCDIGFVGVFGIDMPTSLRRRCEHANAFSFKHQSN
jgi:hypothetical protein